MSVVGLFAGIGGFEKAFANAGFETSLLADIDPACQAVLRERFPGVPVVGDVRDISALPSDTEIVAAGFPCQDLSMAGSKSGIGGGKSGVVDEMFRLIAKARTPTIVIENVYFMLQLDRGLAMRSLAERFEALGYAWAYRVLNTQAFGLPHRRKRVYIVASLTLDPREVLFADEAEAVELSRPSLTMPLGFYWTEGRSGVGLTVDGIPPLKVGSSLGIASAPAVLFPDGAVLTPGVAACERLQGYAAGWTRAAANSGRRSESRLVGNAVSVPVADWVAERIRSPKAMLALPVCGLDAKSPWPSAAYNAGTGRFSVGASERPMQIACKSVTDYLDESWTPLSERALRGFLKRAREGGLRFPEGFLAKLDSAIAESERLAA